MAKLNELLKQAVDHHRGGRLREAADLYDKILREAPQHAPTLHLRGLVAFDQGDDDVAARRMSQAVRIDSKQPAWHDHLGLTWQRLGKPDLAKESFQRALRIDPRYAAAILHLAETELALGHGLAARCRCEEMLAIDPESLVARFLLARSCKMLGELADAERHYRDVAARDGHFPGVWNNLGSLLLQQGRLDDAIETYRQGTALCPESADLWYGLGVAWHESGRYERAVDAYKRSLDLAPADVVTRENLGSALRSLGRIDDAIDQLRQASRDGVDGSLVRLAHALAEAGQETEARTIHAEVARRRPSDWMAQLRHARQCPLLFDDARAIDDYRAELDRALDELLERPRPCEGIDLARSGLEPSFYLPFHGRDDRPLKEKYARLFLDRVTPRPVLPSQDGRPHVGILVTDGNEPLFLRSMGRLIRRLDRREYRLSIVASTRGRDVMEPTLQVPDMGWVPLPARFDQACESLREARFDLLYFWEVGTDGLNYFLPFAGVARRQITSWGIQVTTGNPRIDAYVSSDLWEPADASSHYTEKLILLSSLLSCQERRGGVSSIDRHEIGCRSDENVYVCAQNPGRLHPDFVGALAQILDADPDGRLVLTATRHPAIGRSVMDLLQRHLGPLARRVSVLPALTPADYHGLLALADVVLDPFPFSGVNTTYDAISFHRPMVTMPGSYQRGRFPLGCLRRMGLEDWAAGTVEEYVRRAVTWGRDRDARQWATEQLADRSDAVFDDPRAAGELDDLFHRLTHEV